MELCCCLPPLQLSCKRPDLPLQQPPGVLQAVVELRVIALVQAGGDALYPWGTSMLLMKRSGELEMILGWCGHGFHILAC
jgi:hypothetical protein